MKISLDQESNLKIPPAFLQRRNLPTPLDFWLFEREGEPILLPRLPNLRKLYIEVTTGCNLQCRFCMRNIWDDPIALMTRDIFDAVAARLAFLPALEEVVFTSFGEPLTHPNILSMIETFTRRGLKVTLGSNGILLTPKIVSELIKLGVYRVMVSIDGAQAETFHDLRGANLQQIITNLEHLKELKKQHATRLPELGIEFVILKSNADELPALVRLASGLGAARLIVSNVLAYTEDMVDQTLYGYAPVDSVKGFGFPNLGSGWWLWNFMEMPRMHWGAERHCRFVHSRAAVVGWDGGVSPCYALSHNYSYYTLDGRKKKVTRYILGNVTQTPLDEIWMSEEYMQYRSEVAVYHFPSCPDCDLRSTCDLRELNEGCWGVNPSCADCLWSQDIIRCP
jgi:tungsten cofactor oxidoreducase radical SAM maturase